MKNIYFAFAILASTFAFSQVGIGTNSPNQESILDIVSTTKGVLIPRVNLTSTTLDLDGTGGNPKSLLVFNEGTALPEGFYFWNGTAWTSLSGGGSSAGDASSDVWVDNSAGTAVLSSKPVVIGSGTSADASAILDMSAVTNKGMIAPNVALTSNTDITTVENPKIGLLVYNTGTSTLTTAGYLFWNGTEWRTIYNTSAINPAITSLNCTNASVFPTNFTNGTVYSGNLTVPYTGGNGGAYNGGTPFTQNGLTFTLQPGVLSSGSGSITYSISGTPDFSSPSTISVPISFLGQSCNVTTIGAENTYSIGESRGFTVAVAASTFTGSQANVNWMSGKGNAAGTADLSTWNTKSMITAAGQLTNPGVVIVKGLRLDFLNNGGSVTPVVYNTTSSVIRYHTSAQSTNDSVVYGISNYIKGGYYGGYFDGDNNFSCSNNGASEYSTAQLTFDDGEWYRVEFTASQVDNVYHGYWVVTRIQ